MSATPMFTATITGTGATSAFSVGPNISAALLLSGGTATIQLECSSDGGATWDILAASGTQLYVYPLAGTGMKDTLEGDASGLQYRFNCTAFSSAVTVKVLV